MCFTSPEASRFDPVLPAIAALSRFSLSSSDGPVTPPLKLLTAGVRLFLDKILIAG